MKEKVGKKEERGNKMKNKIKNLRNKVLIPVMLAANNAVMMMPSCEMDKTNLESNVSQNDVGNYSTISRDIDKDGDLDSMKVYWTQYKFYGANDPFDVKYNKNGEFGDWETVHESKIDEEILYREGLK
jgi:hypothetical protein